VSRTVGLPGLEVDDEWFEPMGVASLLVEGLFVLLYIYVMSASGARSNDLASAAGSSAADQRQTNLR